MTEELLKAIHAKTNAIDAVNAALKAEWELLEELDTLLNPAEGETVPLDSVRAKVDALRSLNSALPAAVVANVAPDTAGSVGKSPTEHVFEQADTIVAESLARVAQVAKTAAQASEAMQAMFSDLQIAAQAIGAAKAMQEPEA